jgi:predicted lipoprotein with Yx(FWY)xxD motif
MNRSRSQDVGELVRRHLEVQNGNDVTVGDPPNESSPRFRTLRITGKWLVVRVIGAVLLVATGAIHLDLYLTGYRTIPTIGWLFLLQVITAFGLAGMILLTRSRLVSAMGAGFSVSTLGGYLVSLGIGLFGFREVRTADGLLAGLIEVAAIGALGAFALSPIPERGPTAVVNRGSGLVDVLVRNLTACRWAAAASTIAAAAVLGTIFATTGAPSISTVSAEVTVNSSEIHGVSVLTNGQGFTLYRFAPDTPTRSTCYGTCAVYWPPVTGSPKAGAGVAGTLGTIKRSAGVMQVTYDHHPLYSYVGDSAPGQENGNDINLNGGRWYAVTVSG